MNKKFYLDTCIWRDFLEDRKNHIRLLGELAFQFLRKCRKDNSEIIVSDIVLKELHKYVPKEKIQELLLNFTDLIVKVKHSREQFDEANAFWENNKKVFPAFDVLHSIIARDEKAILVRRDKHFSEIGIVESFTPEELF